MENVIVETCDNEQVKALKRQIISLEAQLEIQKEQASALKGGCLLKSEAIDYYPGEQLDFIISILQQVKERCPEGSRPYDIIESLLSLNKPVGRGQEILNELNRIFKKGMPSTESDITALKSIGFTYTQSRKHPKLRFQDKYMFVLPSTTSDKHRSSKNCLAEINKCLAISQKV